ncbi:MAG TPA: glucoamylase family protein, partial [Blastocatellia bacterium]|nr:glucoamylase family protein [Blastocatellia bacterium]
EKPGTPQKVNWNIPWPPSFPANDVDVVSFVVQDIKNSGLETGELRIDNVVFSVSGSPAADLQHAVWNINHFDGVDARTGFLGGNLGEFSSDESLTGSAIQATTDAARSANTDGKRGASLRFSVDLSQVDFAGEFISLFGHTAFPADYNIDLTQFSQIQLKLLADAGNTQPLRLRVEVKDYRDDFDFTAYRYVTLPPSEGKWQTVVLDADITNREQWFFNRFQPDPKRAKLLVVVAEKFFNPVSFAFNLDEIRLIHATNKPLPVPKIKKKKKNDGLDSLLDHIEQKTWLHFDRWVANGSPSDSDLYLFLDRSSFPDLVSTAAAGFGLSAICVAHHRGWIGDAEATSRVVRVLKTYANRPMVNDLAAGQESIDKSVGARGWFWHFLERDGSRKTRNFTGELLPDKDRSELSSVDTAILVWGALAAKAYFNSTDTSINPVGPGPRASEIANLVDKIYSRVDFPFFVRKNGARANQIYHAWKPELVNNSGAAYAIPVAGDNSGREGYFSGTPENAGTWNYYTDEVLMILLLGVNSPNPNYRLDPALLRGFEIEMGSFTSGGGETVGPIVQSFFGSAFTYFFQQCFIKLDSDYADLVGHDYFNNAQDAARANWLYCRDLSAPTFKGNVFGLTAADGRGGIYHGEWGAPPKASDEPTNDGTVAVYGPTSFIAIWPDKFRDRERVASRNPSMDALVTLYTEGRIFDESIGFGDALNLVPDANGLPFYNMATFGIDNGPMLMMIENERSGLFWKLGLLNPNR